MIRKVRLRSTIGLIALILALGAACAPDEPSGEVLREDLSSNFGEVVLSYAQPLEETDQLTDALRFSARFVRIRDIARQEERFFWGEELPWAEVPLNECQEPRSRPEHDQMLAGSLELLDAGDLTLQAINEEQRIPDWNFPSVYGVVAGVIYGADEPLDVGFQPGTVYRLASNGSDQIAPFEIALRAPNELLGVTVGGIEAGIEPIIIDGPNPVEVRWEPGEEGGEVLAEISFAQFSTEQRRICRSRDDGYLEIPASITSGMWEAGVSDARIILYRVRRQTFATEGLEEAEALFIVSLAIPLQLP